MKATSDLTALYRSFPAYLWVEDEETRSYLETAWSGESNIKVYVADGHVHLEAVVKAAQNDGYKHVFGFRDRDFGTSNRQNWDNPELVVLSGETFELENYLLDPIAISACAVNTANLTEKQIEIALIQLATPLTWWMSCRRTITEIRDAVTDNFIRHPKRGSVSSQRDAETAIVGTHWWTTILPSLQPAWGNSGQVTTRLVAHEQDFRGMLANGNWKREWSGKELLRDLVARVWTRKRTPDPAGRLEFVRAIAEVQRDNNWLPAEIKDLRTAIRKRIGH